MTAMNKWDNALEAGRVITNATVSILKLHLNLVIKAIDDGISRLNREFFPRCIKAELHIFS